jgi:RimJ/RimL family protein N-acetyltransferase
MSEPVAAKRYRLLAAPPAELRERLVGWATDFAEGRAFRYALLVAEGGPADVSGGALLGGADLHPRSATGRVPLAAADRVEIGYWLSAGAEGRGLAAEAVRALLDVAATLPSLAHAEARVDPRNARSAAVARRLGFEHAGSEGGLDVWRLPLGDARRHRGQP